MTVPRPKRATPGGFAYASHPVGALWAVLVIGLLMALPCSGNARAAAENSPVQAAAAPVKADAAPVRAAPEHAARERVQHPHSTTAAAAPTPSPLSWCSADDPGPRPGDGCSGHRFNGQDAQLPNAPPQPVPAALPQLVPAGSLPQAGPSSARPGAVAAPDLHLLQVNRT